MAQDACPANRRVPLSTPFSRVLPLLFGILFLSAPGLTHAAASKDTGTVAGRVYNPDSAEYVRDAQVRALSTGETVYTEAGGFYQISGLPAGNVSLVLSYAGMPDVTRNATVVAGETARLDFDLPVAGSGVRAPKSETSAGNATVAGKDDDVVVLEAVSVTAQREGQAKMTMRERSMMEIGQSISSDLFGDDPEGNVGEFLRNIPGILVNVNSGEATDVSIGGLTSEYTNISVDGESATIANVDNEKRSSTFELVSLNSMESIEVLRTVSADSDANAPAGTINLRSKTAFDRRGTHGAVRAVLNAHSSALNFHKDLGPDDNRGVLKARPGFLAEFSHAVDNKFGVVVNVSESNTYTTTNRVEFDNNFTPTANDPRPIVPNFVRFSEMPRVNHRFASSIRADWRIFPRLIIGASVNYNLSESWSKNRQITFNTGVGANRANSHYLTGPSTTDNFITSSPSSSIQVYSPSAYKTGQYISPRLRLEYKSRNYAFDASASYADSKSTSDSYSEKTSAYNVGRVTASNANFWVQRSGEDFTITQLTGGNISNGEAFGSLKGKNIYVLDDRETTAKVLTAQANLSFFTRAVWPIQWKVGIKSREEKRTFQDPHTYLKVSYQNDLNYADFRSAYEFDFGNHNSKIITPSGGSVYMPDTSYVGHLYRDNPGDFKFTGNALDYYNSFVTYNRNYKERVDAAYIVANTSFFKKRLLARAGIRYEGTYIDIAEFTPHTNDEVKAAGYTLDANGIATSVDGVKYQFFDLPQKHNKQDYRDFFPSASIKYLFRKNLFLHLGVSTTIRRPGYRDLIGVRTVSDTDMRVYVPNKDLEPEEGLKFAARLTWYPKGAGQVYIAAYQDNIKRKIQQDEMSAWEYGDQEIIDKYPGYTVYSRFNSGEDITLRNFEIGWRHNLGFIVRPLRTVTLRLNYTRTTTDYTIAYAVPHSINAGLSWQWRRINLYANCNWTDTFPVTATGQSLREHRYQLDIGGDWKFLRRYTLSFRIRNVLDTPYVWLKDVPGAPRIFYTKDYVGAAYSLSFKAAF